jgi:hypothetical protein
MSETKTVRPNDGNQPGVPLSYVFKSRGTTKKPNSAKLPSSRLTSILSSAAEISVKNCPPRTYQYKRLQFDRHDDSDRDMLNRTSIDNEILKATRFLRNYFYQTDSEQRIRNKYLKLIEIIYDRDEDERRSRFENVPKTYQMKSSYKREDPPASHKMIKEETPKATEAMVCDCIRKRLTTEEFLMPVDPPE